VLLGRLLQARPGLFLRFVRCFPLGLHTGQLGRVHELLERQWLFNIAHVLHDQAAKPDQKACKHERNEPQGTLHPFFSQAQAFAHDALPGDGQARSLPSPGAFYYSQLR
jgi:hypothetical protein